MFCFLPHLNLIHNHITNHIFPGYLLPFNNLFSSFLFVCMESPGWVFYHYRVRSPRMSGYSTSFSMNESIVFGVSVSVTTQ